MWAPVRRWALDEHTDRARSKGNLGQRVEHVLVNGAVGIIVTQPRGRVLSLTGFTIVNGRIAAMDILADPERLDTVGGWPARTTSV